MNEIQPELILEKPKTTRPRAEQELSRNRILIVEDDVAMEVMLMRALRSLDPFASYQWVTSAEEAQVLIQEEIFSLVIADYYLIGRKTGLDLWEFCEANFPRLPFVVMSSLSAQKYARLFGQSRKVPPQLKKPFDLEGCKGFLKPFMEPAEAVN